MKIKSTLAAAAFALGVTTCGIATASTAVATPTNDQFYADYICTDLRDNGVTYNRVQNIVKYLMSVGYTAENAGNILYWSTAIKCPIEGPLVSQAIAANVPVSKIGGLA